MCQFEMHSSLVRENKGKRVTPDELSVFAALAASFAQVVKKWQLAAFLRQRSSMFGHRDAKCV